MSNNKQIRFSDHFLNNINGFMKCLGFMLKKLILVVDQWGIGVRGKTRVSRRNVEELWIVRIASQHTWAPNKICATSIFSFYHCSIYPNIRSGLLEVVTLGITPKCYLIFRFGHMHMHTHTHLFSLTPYGSKFAKGTLVTAGPGVYFVY